MRKKLSILAVSLTLSFSIIAQQKITPHIKVGFAETNFILNDGNIGIAQQIKKKVRKPADAFPSTLGTKENTGYTVYDLQSNASMQRRILTSGNNVSVSWTHSHEDAPTPSANAAFSDRGTGYAFFNGSVWSAAPTARLEGMRTGFNTLKFDGNGDETAICHEINNSLVLNKKTAGIWTTTPMTTNATNQGIWPHTAYSGNWLYIMTAPLDSNIHSNGIRNGYFFSRSNDNGATWIDNMIPMPLIDSVGHYRGGGNSYAISAQGNNVAILFGVLGSDLTLLSSVDNGASWSKKVIWDWPLDHFDFFSPTMTDTNADNITDTLLSNEGTHSMVMDANGAVHIAFPIVKVYKTGANTGFGYFYETTLAYYNSITDSIKTIDDIYYSYHDCDGDNQFGLGQNYGGSDVNAPGAVYRNIGTLSMPSISIVSGNPQKVLIAYTAIMDNDTTVEDAAHPYWFGSSAFAGQNYRDVLVAVSPDNGSNWNPYPVNVSRTGHFEEAYVSTEELVSGAEFNMVYQGDIEPGTIFYNDDTYDDNFKNLIIVQKIPISQLLTLSLDSTAPCGQSELPLGIKHVVNGKNGFISVYPNPANEMVNLSFKFLSTANRVDIQIINVAGNQLFNRTLNQVNETTTSFDIKSLAAGLYFIKITTEEGTEVKRFFKE